MIAPYLANSLINLFKPENKGQFRLRIDPNSTKMNDFLIHGKLQVSLYNKMITSGDSTKTFKLDGDLLKVATKYKFNADHSTPQDKKILSLQKK